MVKLNNKICCKFLVDLTSSTETRMLHGKSRRILSCGHTLYMIHVHFPEGCKIDYIYRQEWHLFSESSWKTSLQPNVKSRTWWDVSLRKRHILKHLLFHLLCIVMKCEIIAACIFSILWSHKYPVCCKYPVWSNSVFERGRGQLFASN